MQNPSTPAATQPTRILRPGPDFRWPGGARIAMVFNIAYEGWSDGKTSGIGPMGNVLAPGYFDTNAHSWGQYGPLRGIHRKGNIAAVGNQDGVGRFERGQAQVGCGIAAVCGAGLEGPNAAIPADAKRF